MNQYWVPTIVGTVFFLTVGGVIILRPIAKRLGEFLEVLIQEKRKDMQVRGDDRMRRMLGDLEQRMSLLEDRLEFAEDLLDSDRERRPPGRIESGGGTEEA